MSEHSEHNEEYEVCTEVIGEVLKIVAVKRAVHVIGELHDGPQRFNRLRRNLGNISTQSLTVILRHLEQNGIIQRQVMPTMPVTVEYSLTEQGREFEDVLNVIHDWGASRREHQTSLGKASSLSEK
ncbi:helix-turn-helix domain-containing protein [Paenibacillus glucanolyticus]|uniref:winged helix-turn-helix transcriptional regulator n=1 Tax=Paenibacillus glucanolyticus TaxID=59843 RepID=UPI0030C8F2DA